MPKRIAEARSIKLGAESVTVKLNPLDAGEEGPRSLPARVARLEPGRKIHLVVEDLRMQAPPGVLFDLYLDLPRGATAEQKTRHKVGVINFFNASGEEPGKEPGEEKPGAGEPRFISFDITDILKKMQAQGALKEESTLTIVPVGKVAADSRPSIGRLSLTSS